MSDTAAHQAEAGRRRWPGLIGGPLAAGAGLVSGPPAGLAADEWAVAMVALLMAVWWMSEALPLAATALAPIVLFPVLGVMPTAEVTVNYGNHLVFLFLGGFFIAVTMQRWDLHRRIAFYTINLFGTDARRMLLGFMVATAGLSMWISNTATAMMMLPIALAVLAQAREEAGQAGVGLPEAFGVTLMLGIAYAASIGGVATLIGTPPNALLAGMASDLHGVEVTFAGWMAFALPLSLLMLALAWMYLAWGPPGRGLGRLPTSRAHIRAELAALGPITAPQARVLAVFVLVAMGWIARGFLPDGWLEQTSDASIAMAGALALFILPAGDGSRRRLLDWPTAAGVPWDIVLLFGGGFALAAGFSDSGLSGTVAGLLEALADVPLLVLIAACVALVVLLTEMTSNTAVATLFIPLMGALAVAVGVPPLILMTAVAVAASCAFMLPVATPPNAVVFGSRAVTIPQMARVGLVMNIATVVLATLFVYSLLPRVMTV